MSWSRRSLLLAILGLAACGFTPVYAPDGSANSLQGQIGFATPEDRAEYLVIQRIEDRLGRAADPRWILALELSTRTEDLGTTADGDTTRFHVSGTANYSLRETGADAAAQAVTEGRVNSFTAYSATGSTVATLAAERDAERRLMVILADQLVDRLILAAP